jgi:hypothetical protein
MVLYQSNRSMCEKLSQCLRRPDGTLRQPLNPVQLVSQGEQSHLIDVSTDIA